MRFFADLRIREVELGTRLARRCRIIALDRSEVQWWDMPHLSAKLRMRWELARGGWARWEDQGLRRFRMPVTVGTGPLTNRLAAHINERRIARAVERFECGTVFHSHPFLFMPPVRERRSYRFHFDLVDNFYDGFPDSFVGRSRKRFVRDALLRADTLSAISQSLCDRIEELVGRRPSYVPNGAAIDAIDAWPASRAAAVRARYALDGKTALAYIGNHIEDFDGTEMLVEAFLKAHKVRPELALLLVGPGSDRVPRARGIGLEQGVHVVGPVPTGEVWDYFHAADLGLLPFVLEPGTHHSLPIKVLEFGAACKPMLATPLDELRRMNLPHLRFAPYDSEAWGSALLDAAVYARPDPARMKEAMKPYSWSSATDALARAMGLD